MEVDAAHSSAAVHGRLHAVAGKEDTHEEHSHMRCLRAASVTGRLQRRTWTASGGHVADATGDKAFVRVPFFQEAI